MPQGVSRIVLALALLGLAGCDFIRFPGDGGPSPTVPEAGPELPPGAPGPPPPSEPVNPAPTDDGDENDAPDQTDTTDTDTGADDTSVTPIGDDDADVDDTGTVVDVPDTDASDTDVADTDLTGDETDVVDADTDTDAGDTDVDTQEDPVTPPTPVEPAFSYYAPGALLNGSGQGEAEQIVHAPDIVFPIKDAPTFLQSMVFTYGGGIGGGDQCDPRNYEYPWRDNFCEKRSANRNSPFCPTSRVHQGQDIRVGTAAGCNALRRTPAAERGDAAVVAVEDGIISNVGSYSVNVRAGGRIYKYMHMNMKRLEVTSGQFVSAGDTLGYVSNDFGGTPTTFHLHFEIVQNTAEHGWAHVPPYLSLVEAYERREGGPGERIEPLVGVASAPPIVIPEGFEIVE